MNCNKTVHPISGNIGECSSCQTNQKLKNPKQTAKLIVETATKKYMLRAYNYALHAITNIMSTKEVSAEDLLFAPPFDCTCNKFNVISSISCP